MVSAAIVSALHVLALAIGLPAIFWRGRALRAPLDAAGLGRLFAADAAWGLAALLWIVTGLLRAFGGLEKGAGAGSNGAADSPTPRTPAGSTRSPTPRWRWLS